MHVVFSKKRKKEIKAVENKLENCFKMKEKEVSVAEDKFHVDTGEGSNYKKPLQQYKRRGGYVKGCNNNQKLSVAFKSAGKLGRFLASMNLGLINLKTDRKSEGNSVNKLETSKKREVAIRQSVDVSEVLGITQNLK